VEIEEARGLLQALYWVRNLQLEKEDFELDVKKKFLLSIIVEKLIYQN
jgi:hypothetical protein